MSTAQTNRTSLVSRLRSGRRTPARSLALLGGAALLALLGGCSTVPQDKYDALMTANRSLQEQLVSAEDERDGYRDSLGRLQGELGDARSQLGSLQQRYDMLAKAAGDLEAGNADFMRRIAELEVGPLPPDVEDAIASLAESHPELFTFDSRLGLLRFSSDFTFALGSVELQSEARSTLGQLASVLNGASARGLEARIIGHTDDVPIGKPETRRAHPTNTHLSVHRAIAVRDALVGAGMSAQRIMVAGYGEYRPLVTNEAKRGAAANRRVEIYLAAMTGTATNAGTVATPERTAPPARAVPEK